MNIREAYLLPDRGRRAASALWRSGIVFLSLFLSFASAAHANWLPLKERLVADGFDEQSLQTLFSSPDFRFEPKVMAGKISVLVRRHQERPYSPGPRDHNKTYRNYLTSRVIAKARTFLKDHRTILKEASARYCVPEEVVVSILLVETGLGRNKGKAIVFNKLASMALAAELETIRPYLQVTITPANEDYARLSCRQKADWAYNELKALLNFAGKSGVDPLGIRGSIYGAIGLCQFMPSNVFSYGIDADSDGQVDPFVTADAIHSIANYLHKHGWNCGINRAGRRKVVFEYNRSTVYVNTVLAVAEKISGGAKGRR